MSEWVIRLGISLIVLGLVLFSPLGDLLPVDFWGSVKRMLSSSREFVRYVPAEENNLPKFVLIGLGLVLVACGFYLKTGK